MGHTHRKKKKKKKNHKKVCNDYTNNTAERITQRFGSDFSQHTTTIIIYKVGLHDAKILTGGLSFS